MNMPSEQPTMRAVQIQEYKAPLKVSDVQIPKIKPHQILIRIKAGGFCHSDVQAHAGDFNSPLPYIGSHEAVGIVEEIGSNVEIKRFKVGDRVGSLPYGDCCGKCPDCKTGHRIFCPDVKFPGISKDGAWAEYMAADPNSLVHIPQHVSWEQAAAHMCAGLSIYGAIITAEVKKGDSLAIIGIGGLGHIGTQIAKSLGISVIAVDTAQPALDLAMSFKHKPDVCMNPKNDETEDILEKLGQDQFGYKGVDATILAVDAEAAFKAGFALTKTHGKVVLLGQPKDGITVKYQDTIYRDIKLVGSWGGTLEQVTELLQLVEREKIEVQVKTWDMEEVEKMRTWVTEGKSAGKNVILI